MSHLGYKPGGMVARQGPSMPPHSWPSSTNEAVHDGEYLVCDALRMVGAQPFIVTQAALPAHAAKALYERLDLRTFPSSLRNRADGPTHTLKTLLAFGFWLLAFGFWQSDLDPRHGRGRNSYTIFQPQDRRGSEPPITRSGW